MDFNIKLGIRHVCVCGLNTEWDKHAVICINNNYKALR